MDQGILNVKVEFMSRLKIRMGGEEISRRIRKNEFLGLVNGEW